jgi:hypothetical protein
VVLAILVAIGGLVVPLLGNYLHRANIASCTVNIPEMDKWIQTYVNLYSSYPDRMDNLCVATGGLASYVQTGAGGDYGASFTAVDLTAGDAAALNDAGITTLCNIVEDAGGDWNPTFWPYNNDRDTAPTTTLVAADVEVATLTATGMRLMGLPGSTPANTNYKYVIFGVNTPCTLFRNIAEEAPYHFADTPAEDPASFYMAFGAVFMVARPNAAGTGSEPLESAKYMGTIAFHDFGLSTAGMHTQEWWSRLKDEAPDL